MQNPKTSVLGILTVLGALATFVAHLLGGTVSPADLSVLVTALTGVGLIVASDGKP